MLVIANHYLSDLSAIAGRKALATAEAISVPEKAVIADLTVIKGMNEIRRVCPACPEPVEGSFRKSCRRHDYPESILHPCNNDKDNLPQGTQGFAG